MFEKLFPFVIFVLIVMAYSCKAPMVEVRDAKHLPAYPSGSGLAYMNGNIYLAGDDAAFLVVLDKDLNITDSLSVWEAGNGRIAKARKPDFEAMATIEFKGTQKLLLLGSGSAAQRNVCRVFTGNSGKTELFDIGIFYKRLQELGVKEVNVEGATMVQGSLVLGCRGNKAYPKNYLLFTKPDFYLRQDSAAIKPVKLGTQTDSSVFNGISGLDYSYRSDKLFVTVSTENVYNSYDDGRIGKSYLWIVNDISSRKRFGNLNADRIIDLEQEDGRFKGHKIESVCILKEDRSETELLLAADNDKGDTWLFKIVIQN